MIRYVKDACSGRIYSVVLEGQYLLLVDAERPETPPYSIAAVHLLQEERFTELEVASTPGSSYTTSPLEHT